LKEPVVHEMEKASYQPKNSKKRCKRSDGAVCKAKNIEQRIHKPSLNPRLCPAISKNTPTKQGQNKPENTKTD